jgi:ABC-type spermidine/putrescine transport system permease subunit I
MGGMAFEVNNAQKAKSLHGVAVELLVIPAFLFTLIFFVYPIGKILLLSFSANGFTLEHYKKIIQTPLYLSVIWDTCVISLVVTSCCAVIGYPLALFLNKAPSIWRRPLFLIICLPLWTSLLARNYAWMMTLQSEGIINKALLSLGLIDQPLSLLHNRFSVTVAMVHALLPFMVLPIYTAIRNVNLDTIDAAQNLGASNWRCFLRVLLPLTSHGVATGAFATFILALGYFITPALLGGRNDITITMLIDTQANRLLNWGFASALSVVLLIMTIWAFVALGKSFNKYSNTSRS